jgi:phosphoribosylformylglycinamidine cyclo-ligase
VNSDYAAAGVNIDKGNEAVDRIKRMARQYGVDQIGKFGGYFPFSPQKKGGLVSSADGVGTKLKVAFMMNRHDTIGQDLVNHCVDDILVHGANPLFFMDYIATGVLEPQVVEKIVSGMLEACLQNGLVLLGGETAEMPGFYQAGEYDVAGFIVGWVDEDRIVEGKTIQPGDLLIGLPSTGLHTNGYSLARKVLFGDMGLKVDAHIPSLGTTVGEALLAVHRSYLKPVRKLLDLSLIKGMAHITGGGFYENIPRTLPDNMMVHVQRTWPVPDLFTYICESGKVREEEAFRVFNMGIGMVLFIDQQNLSTLESALKEQNEPYYLIGQVDHKKDDRRVVIA